MRKHEPPRIPIILDSTWMWLLTLDDRALLSIIIETPLFGRASGPNVSGPTDPHAGPISKVRQLASWSVTRPYRIILPSSTVLRIVKQMRIGLASTRRLPPIGYAVATFRTRWAAERRSILFRHSRAGLRPRQRATILDARPADSNA